MSRLFGSPWSSVLQRNEKAGCVPDSAPAYGRDAGREVIWTGAADGRCWADRGCLEVVCATMDPPAWDGIAIVMDPETDCMSGVG
jgi:hypothetical protein